MPLIFKRTPGSTVGYEWTEPDQGVEVEDRELAYGLLHMDADFYEKAVQSDGTQVEITCPPKAGPGSNAAAWREYAQANGVRVNTDARRDDVIGALEAAGVLTQAQGDEIIEAGEAEVAGAGGDQAESEVVAQDQFTEGVSS